MHIDRKSPNRQITGANNVEEKRFFFSHLTLNQLFRLKRMSFIWIRCVCTVYIIRCNVNEMETKRISVSFFSTIRIHFINISCILIFHFGKLARFESKSIKMELKISNWFTMHTKLNLRYDWKHSMLCGTKENRWERDTCKRSRTEWMNNDGKCFHRLCGV